MFMGGEYLPKLEKGEVEIARISLRSVTADQISARARRIGAQIEYAIVDEYGDSSVITYRVQPRTWAMPRLCRREKGKRG